MTQRPILQATHPVGEFVPWIGYRCGMCGRWFRDEPALREHVGTPRGWRRRAMRRLAHYAHRASGLATRLALWAESRGCEEKP